MPTPPTPQNPTMPNNNDAAPSMAVTGSSGSSTLIDVLAAQFSHLESGEVRSELERHYGDQVWTTDELCAAFGVSHFAPPYVHVIRRHDACRGTVAYIDAPRFYFSFVPDKENQK